MEQEPRMTHLTYDELASFWSGTSAPETQERLSAHVDGCATCAARLESLEPPLSQYNRCLELVHARTRRTRLTEADLRRRMREIDAGRAHRRLPAWRPVWVSGISAALVAVALFLFPYPGGTELRADTLLDQAAIIPPQAGSGRVLRFKMGGASFERPAALVPVSRESPGEAAIRARFAEAHYDWADPLSARSFREWRRGLKRKKSNVSAVRGEGERKVEVKTDEGALREATLTLDAKLLPVSAWFRFADQEWVEITTAPAAASPDSDRFSPRLPASAAAAAPVLEKSPMEPLAERELTVRLAIDVVHPGAGEPIEVSVDPDGSLLVTTYRLAPELETELRARLERIQGVTLHSATGGQAPQPIAPPDASALDRAIPLSQDVSFEAHFLAELATRFTPPMESELSAQSRTSLRELRVKHVAELKRGLAALRLQLERQHPDFHPGPSPAESPDGLQIQSMADSATNVERSIAVLYAGSEPESEQAASWRQLAAALGSLQGLATSYSRYLEQHRKELQ